MVTPTFYKWKFAPMDRFTLLEAIILNQRLQVISKHRKWNDQLLAEARFRILLKLIPLLCAHAAKHRLQIIK